MAIPSRADIMKLDVAARLELIEALWESIVDDDDAAAQLPLTDAERTMLDERLRDHRAGHSGERPWHDVRADILNKPR
ncbi:MAG: addiction module protein [Solirubrobacteraceae bacterium]